MAWTAGAVLTAADLNTYLPQAVTAWASPISGGITVGNGTTSAFQMQDGDMMNLWFFFSFGSTSAITTSVDLALPSAAVAAAFVHGIARLEDSSAATDHTAQIYGISTTVARLEVLNASGTYLALNNLSSTIPFTWATSDNIAAHLSYPIG
jgi:hypothetical protein